MNDEVKKLEQEANDARARLKSDLLVLSSSHTYEAFKEDLRTEANDTLSKLIDGAKARVAANPAAALAIGAGIAWRIIERPPIAATLIGAGLFSLFRTSPPRRSPLEKRDYLFEGQARLKEQVGDFVAEVRDEVVDMANLATNRASEVAGAATEKVRDVASAATSKTRESAANLGQRVSDVMNDAEEFISEAPSRVGRMAQAATATLDDAISDAKTRDTILLGVAGLAVATALGIAFQRTVSADQ
jgi:ElaB/YqjD/DUF883 family membrane-anchored ribosome-binding protein